MRSLLHGAVLLAAIGAPPAREGDPAASAVEVTFESGGETLAATILLPPGAGPFPGVVLVHGSGSSDRSNPWTSACAVELVRRGIAVLHPDKRGSGKSGGDWRDAGLEDLADDAVAAVEVLAARLEVDGDQVGVLGFSQGGSVVPIAAARASTVAFVIDVSGSTVPLLEQVGDEIRRMGQREGLRPEELEEVMHVHELSARYVAGDAEFEEYRAALDLLLEGPLGSTDVVQGFPRDADHDAWRFARAAGNPDPMEWWSELEQPLLFVYGGNDTQVDVFKSLARIEAELGPLESNFSVLWFRKNGHALLRDDMMDFVARWIASRGAP